MKWMFCNEKLLPGISIPKEKNISPFTSFHIFNGGAERKLMGCKKKQFSVSKYLERNPKTLYKSRIMQNYEGFIGLDKRNSLN